MSPNPYQPPEPPRFQMGMAPQAPVADASRKWFVLAAVGAGLASFYWGLLTLLLLFAATSGSGSVSLTRIILPCVLVGLYAVRGFQLFKGDPAAATRILWLHGVGGLMAILQIVGGDFFWAALQSFKLVIHVFGAIMAYQAQKSYQQNFRV